MKVVLETIPVWDAFKKETECPICLLMEEAEKDGVSYYLSSAIMTPEVRVETNDKGFCPHHFLLLSQGGKPQSLALVMDTYYEKNKETFSPYFKAIASSTNPRKAQKGVAGLRKAAEEREKGCLICKRMEDRLERYLFTVASLYSSDKEFKDFFSSSKGLCLHHSLLLGEMADEALKGD